MKRQLEKNQDKINEYLYGYSRIIARRQERDRLKRQEAEGRREQGLGSEMSSIGPSEISASNNGCRLERSEYLHIEVVEKYQVEVQCGPQTKESAVATQESDNMQVDQQAAKEKKQKKKENAENEQPLKVQELQGEELSQVVKSRSFNDFLNRSSKFLQKVLDHSEGRVMQDIINENFHDKQKYTHHYLRTESQVIKKLLTFSDANHSIDRVVTDLDWSSEINQLFLASYSQREYANIKDHVGIVLVWDASLKNRAEFVCYCQSQVTCAKFYPFTKSNVIGGCENGQIMVWDLRDKQTPIIRTGITSNSHKYPICSLNIVGTKMAHNIISYSSDGMMCVWDIRMLSKPIKTTQLIGKRTQNLLTYFQRSRGQSVHDINIKCCSFPQGDPNNYYIGSFNGAMYRNAVHNKGNQNVEMFSQHEGPISGISINSHSQYKALDNLILTSSYDWTVKLWHPESKQSICTFEGSDDYIYDVSWHPTNPSLFATANNQGYLDVFDLTRSFDAPIAHKGASENAQNRCAWNREGSCIISGDSLGEISLFGLNQQYMKMDPQRYSGLVESLQKKMQSD